MTLIIEDGSKVSDANSYVTEAEYTTWANARFGSSRSTKPVDSVGYEAIILRAMDYFESLEFRGTRTYEDQSLQWPRAWVVIDRYAVESDEIPKEVKNAIYELTYAEEIGDGELNQIERKVEKEKVGPLEVTYSSASSSRVINTSVSKALRKLISSAGGSGFSVSRA